MMGSLIIGLAVLGSLAGGILLGKRRAAKGRGTIAYRHSRIDDEIDRLLEKRMIDGRDR
jgi:hypothetical protein